MTHDRAAPRPGLRWQADRREHRAGETDLPAAEAFLTSHARLLDRRRLPLALGWADAGPALAALEAYRNPDGGYGWGLEPDLRASESQPAAALHAFEVFEDAGPATTPRAVELCDWLTSASLPDGGLPFALPVADAAGCAPFWAQADPTVSSLQITAAVATAAHRVAVHHPDVAGHPWLAWATSFSLTAIRSLSDTPHAYELSFALQFLDAAHENTPEAGALLDRLGVHLPADGVLPVEGGNAGESLRLLDHAPHPHRPVRRLFAAEAVAAELRRLAQLQQGDGGWPVDFASYSPVASLEWRGYATVHAVSVLRRNGVLP